MLPILNNFCFSVYIKKKEKKIGAFCVYIFKTPLVSKNWPETTILCQSTEKYRNTSHVHFPRNASINMQIIL